LFIGRGSGVLIGAAASKILAVICVLMQEGNTQEQLQKYGLKHGP
jgi:hypothetical protein